ncbi:hypothetical protein GH714_032010 [Hevea brasiliensis]|uniref:Uncharacterized protein n=1 Tax=Hevea brasiliensis TaxID=3981 RepID=A0A6A6LFY4_HEVBR|nr:hypothetical protein GH714_032010 [Hevea brasiliensis]
MFSDAITVLEMEATKVVKPEAAEACGSHDQINVEAASGSHVQAIEANEKIMNELKKLRSCYVEDVLKEYPNDDLDLAWMFLMDGCETLAFMFCFAEGMDNKTLQILNINKDDVAFAQQDIFLLENQLPLPLFELLINSVNKEQDKKIIRDSINKFISSRKIFLPPPPSATKI